jgi:hypothetical protein
MQDGGAARAKRSPTSRIVWTASVLVILAGLLFIGWIVMTGLIQGDPREEYVQIENRMDETLTVYSVIEPSGERVLLTTVPPHESVPTGDDCGASEMIATTGAGTEIARRGPFEQCHLETWVIRDVPGT